jgi:hypothetical protein
MSDSQTIKDTEEGLSMNHCNWNQDLIDTHIIVGISV